MYTSADQAAYDRTLATYRAEALKKMSAAQFERLIIETVIGNETDAEFFCNLGDAIHKFKPMQPCRRGNDDCPRGCCD